MSHTRIFIQQLSDKQIAAYLRANDDDLFERLSVRVDIDEYAVKLSKKALHFTAHHGSKLVGLAPCYFNNLSKKTGYISSFIIMDGYRRQGLGKQLLREIMSYGARHQFSKLQVKVHCDNLVLRSFYENSAFFVKDMQERLCLLECHLS